MWNFAVSLNKNRIRIEKGYLEKSLPASVHGVLGVLEAGLDRIKPYFKFGHDTLTQRRILFIQSQEPAKARQKGIRLRNKIKHQISSEA